MNPTAIQKIVAALMNRPDPRLEDDPRFVRDPGNYQENNDYGVTNPVPFDPQALQRRPRVEPMPQEFMFRRDLIDRRKPRA